MFDSDLVQHSGCCTPLLLCKCNANTAYIRVFTETQTEIELTQVKQRPIAQTKCATQCPLSACCQRHLSQI